MSIFKRLTFFFIHGIALKLVLLMLKVQLALSLCHCCTSGRIFCTKLAPKICYSSVCFIHIRVVLKVFFHAVVIRSADSMDLAIARIMIKMSDDLAKVGKHFK